MSNRAFVSPVTITAAVTGVILVVLVLRSPEIWPAILVWMMAAATCAGDVRNARSGHRAATARTNRRQ